MRSYLASANSSCVRTLVANCARPRSVATSPANTPMDSVTKHVNNFRCLSDAHDGMKPGGVYRCACPVNAAEKDMQSLREDMTITTMIDLRSQEEILEFGQAPILSGCHFTIHERVPNGWFGAPKMARSTTTMAGNPEHTPFDVHHISILDRRRFIMALLMRLPPSALGSAAWARLTRGTQASYDIMLGEINKGGLKWLYEIIVDTSQPEIGVALHVVKQTLLTGESAMIFCKAGKDRTGLLSMLILSVAGASDESIVADYHKSAGFGKMALGDLEKNQELVKLDRSAFEGAPEVAMHDALAYIRERYVSNSAYMVRCGFSVEDQAELRQALMA